MNDFIKDFHMLIGVAGSGSDTEADNVDDGYARNPFDATFNHFKNKGDKGTLSSLVV
jgi:hypothetical protein